MSCLGLVRFSTVYIHISLNGIVVVVVGHSIMLLFSREREREIVNTM